MFKHYLLFHSTQTQGLNLKALESAKELSWPFYSNLIGTSSPEKVNYLSGGNAVCLVLFNCVFIFSKFLPLVVMGIHLLEVTLKGAKL